MLFILYIKYNILDKKFIYYLKFFNPNLLSTMRRDVIFIIYLLHQKFIYFIKNYIQQ